MSKLHTLTEPISIEYCEVNYVPIGVKGLSVAIKMMHSKCKLEFLERYQYTSAIFMPSTENKFN